MLEKEKFKKLLSFQLTLYEEKLLEIVKVERKNENNILEIKQSLIGKVNFLKLESNLNSIKEIAEIDCFSISFESRAINNDNLNESLDSYRKRYEEDNLEAKRVDLNLTFTQKLSLPIEVSSSIFIINLNSKIMKKLTNEFLIKDFVNLKEKVNIYSLNDEIFSSSLFCFNNSDLLENQNIEHENLIINNSFAQIKIQSIPDVFDFTVLDDLKTLSTELLSIFCSKRINSELHFSRKKDRIIDESNLSEDFGLCYKELSNIVGYVFYDKKSIDEKMSITRNLIYESISEGTQNIIQPDFWVILSDELKLEYDLYVNDEVSKFLTEKKEIIKEQFNLSNQINNQINNVKKSLISNVVYIIGIFLSKFVIDGLNKGSINYAPFAIYIAFCFSVFLLTTFILSGESKSHEKFQGKLEIINNYYPKLYLTKENIINDLEEKITNPEIKELQRIEMTCLFIYIGSTLIFLIWSSFLLYSQMMSHVSVILNIFLRTIYGL